MTNNLDCRDLMIIDNTIANLNLVEENAKMQKLLNTLLIAGVVVSITLIIISIHRETNRENRSYT